MFVSLLGGMLGGGLGLLTSLGTSDGIGLMIGSVGLGEVFDKSSCKGRCRFASIAILTFLASEM